MSTFKKVLPNFITSIRIFGAVALLFFEPFSLVFFIVYGVCGASDVLDGFLARKFGVQSKVGSVLDSISDLAFYTVMAIVIAPTLIELLSIGNWIVIGIPVLLQIVGYILCAIKFKMFSSVHTYANKFLSFLIFAFPFTFIGRIELLYSLYIYIGSAFAMYAGIEIILIHAISYRYDERNKTVFFVKRNEIDLQEGIQ